MPSDDSIEVRVRTWANLIDNRQLYVSMPMTQGTFTVPRDTPHTFDSMPLPRRQISPMTLAEVQRDASTPGPDGDSARRVLPLYVANARYPKVEGVRMLPTTKEVEMETQQLLMNEARERLEDARRAGARSYDRTKWVQNLGKARTALEDRHEELAQSLAENRPLSPANFRAHQVVVLPGQFVIDAETLLGLERDLAEAQYRWHAAELRLAELGG